MPKVSVLNLLEGVANNPTNKETINRARLSLVGAMENQLGKREIKKVQDAIKILVEASMEGLTIEQVVKLKKTMKKIPPELSIEPSRMGDIGQPKQLLGWRNIKGGKLRAF